MSAGRELVRIRTPVPVVVGRAGDGLRRMDGWSAGWRISDPRAYHLTVELRPQRPASLSLVASLAAMGLVAGLLLGARRRRRDRARPTREDGSKAAGAGQW